MHDPDTDTNPPTPDRWPVVLRTGGLAIIAQQMAATTVESWTTEPVLLAVGLVLVTGRDGIELVRAIMGGGR